MKTLLLDPATWDLTLDAHGNLAIADDPYAVAQDVASALKLFSGELWYDTTKGVPYWTQILGRPVPLQLLKSKLEAAAMTVPGVTAARCFISSIVNREVHGQLQFTTGSGQQAVSF